MAAKVLGGDDFTLEDFLEQMLAVRKMGPIGNLLGMLPGMGQMKEAIAEIDDSHLDRVTAIIRSMTPGERADPKMINASRRRAHREGLRHDGHRREPAGRPLLRGAQDDEADGRPDGPARHEAQRHPVVEEQAQGQEGRRRTQAGPRMPLGCPVGCPAASRVAARCCRACPGCRAGCRRSTSRSSASRPRGHRPAPSCSVPGGGRDWHARPVTVR